MDLIVMTLAGAKEREQSDWEYVFHEADSRFVNIAVKQLEGYCMAIVEATSSG